MFSLTAASHQPTACALETGYYRRTKFVIANLSQQLMFVWIERRLIITTIVRTHPAFSVYFCVILSMERIFSGYIKAHGYAIAVTALTFGCIFAADVLQVDDLRQTRSLDGNGVFLGELFLATRSNVTAEMLIDFS